MIDWLGRFSMIAALHSELLAVSTSGYLYQWCWTDLAPQRPDNPTGQCQSPDILKGQFTII